MQKNNNNVNGIDTEEFFEFHNEFINESDRAAVILGSAKLDYLLYQCLRKYLMPNTGSQDELFDGDAPLSTFSAKINLTYRLGLIDSEFVRALHLIRRMSNIFAHETAGCKLDSGTQRDRIKELVSPFLLIEGYNGLRELFASKKKGAAADFFSCLAIMVIRLQWLFEDVTQLKPSQQHALIPSILKKKSDKKQISE